MTEPAVVPARAPSPGPAAAAPTLTGDPAGAGNAAVTRALTPGPEAAAALVERHTSWGSLDEAALGAELAGELRRGAVRTVQLVLDALGGSDRDDVAMALVAPLADAELAALATTGGGRELLDRLLDEVSSGSVWDDERSASARLLRARAAPGGAAGFAARVAGPVKVFPFRLPGLTVLSDAPIMAERGAGGAVVVHQPVRVAGTDAFAADVATLPSQVFAGGLELAPDEIVGVRLHDLGGSVVYRPAPFLLELANQTDATVLLKLAETAGLALTMGTGELIGLGVETTLLARVAVVADRAATVIGTVAAVVLEHRGEILRAYGERGQRFVRCVELVEAATALYGVARTVYSAGRLIADLRRAHAEFRAALAESGDDALAGELRAADDGVREVLAQADEMAAARPGRAPDEAAVPIPEPAGGGGAAARTADLVDRQAAAELRRSAAANDGLAARVEENAARLLAEGDAERADRARLRAAQLRRRAEAERALADEYATGARSARAELPGPEDHPGFFGATDDAVGEHATAGELSRIALDASERNPADLERLSRELMTSRSGGRVVYRVDGGRGRALVTVDEAGGVTFAPNQTVHLNFGSPERALEFLSKPTKGGAGGRLVRFEVDEAWVRSLRSAAVPDRARGVRGEPQLVDIRLADDQMSVPGELVHELEAFVVPGSGREVAADPLKTLGR